MRRTRSMNKQIGESLFQMPLSASVRELGLYLQEMSQ